MENGFDIEELAKRIESSIEGLDNQNEIVEEKIEIEEELPTCDLPSEEEVDVDKFFEDDYNKEVKELNFEEIDNLINYLDEQIEILNNVSDDKLDIDLEALTDDINKKLEYLNDDSTTDEEFERTIYDLSEISQMINEAIKKIEKDKEKKKKKAMYCDMARNKNKKNHYYKNNKKSTK